MVVGIAWRRLVSLGRKLLFVSMLYGTSWQQTMGGQGRCKHSRKENKTLQDKYKKGSSKAKTKSLWFLVASIVDCVELGTCKNW